MCTAPRMPEPAPAIIPNSGSSTASNEAALEARLRRARSAAAANVLTSARGVPSGRRSTPKLGQPA